MKTSKPSLFSMTMISVSVLFVTGCLAGVRIPSAHSQHQTALPQARTVSVTSKSAKSPNVRDNVSFPKIIDTAVKKIHDKKLVSVKAPTVLPTYLNGSSNLTAQVTTQTAPAAGYNVLFSSHGQRVADFSGNAYKTDSAARAGTAISPDILPHGVTTTSVSLGSIKAHGITYNPTGKHSKNGSSPFAVLRWTQNRWSITVRATETTTLPLPEAQKAAHFLLTHGLPTPDTQASLLITVVRPTNGMPGNLDGHNVSAYVVWQEGKHVYETDTYSACEEPIETVFSMARSMQSYS